MKNEDEEMRNSVRFFMRMAKLFLEEAGQPADPLHVMHKGMSLWLEMVSGVHKNHVDEAKKHIDLKWEL